MPPLRKLPWRYMTRWSFWGYYLELRQAGQLMLGGWLLALTLAVLPLAGPPIPPFSL